MSKIRRLLEMFFNENENYEAGFDLTDISAKSWEQLLEKIGASNLGELIEVEKGYNVWKWKGNDVTIYTGNNPITGIESNKRREPEVGYASYIGIEGSKKMVKFVFNYISKNATYIKDENPNSREYI